MVDEMAVRRHVEWDGQKFHGYEDMGAGISDDSLPVAKEAFVVMIVGVNGQWKLPLGYFLVDGIGGEQRANLVKQALTLAHENGAKVVSLTCDGAPANLTMLRNLGCNFSVDQLATTIRHPDTKEPVFAFLDPCHMLKLLRNALSDKHAFVDRDGGLIQWKFVEDLHDIQQKEGVLIANKLRKSHIYWKNQPMKVSLAAQLFSTSVADAIAECRNLGIPSLYQSRPTEQFIRHVNNVFDILNSRHVGQKLWKKPLCKDNIEEVRSYLDNAASYFSSVQECVDGLLMTETNRKTGFIGFLVCIRSVLDLYKHVVEDTSLMTYLPTYKFSQDHLELFFGVMRSHGRSNDNPTTRQFAAVFKRLIVLNEVKDLTSGNCLPLEQVKILHVTSATDVNSVEVLNWTTARRSLIEDGEDVGRGDDDLLDHDYLPDPRHISELSQRAVVYIAGFVVRFLLQKLRCTECVAALTAAPGTDPAHSLLQRKTAEDLPCPSADVLETSPRLGRLETHRVPSALVQERAGARATSRSAVGPSAVSGGERAQRGRLTRADTEGEDPGAGPRAAAGDQTAPIDSAAAVPRKSAETSHARVQTWRSGSSPAADSARGSARRPPRCRNGATVPRSRLRAPLEPPLRTAVGTAAAISALSSAWRTHNSCGASRGVHGTRLGLRTAAGCSRCSARAGALLLRRFRGLGSVHGSDRRRAACGTPDARKQPRAGWPWTAGSRRGSLRVHGGRHGPRG
ncbi:uncharacterized protein ISCGN_002596 [Ixodes scapularis]